MTTLNFNYLFKYDLELQIKATLLRKINILFHFYIFFLMILVRLILYFYVMVYFYRIVLLLIPPLHVMQHVKI